MTHRLRFPYAAASLLLLAAACGGDGGTGPGPGPEPGFTVSLNPASLTLPRGGSENVTVTVARSGGFQGAVDLVLEGLPAGVTSPGGVVGSGQTTGSITVAAAADAPLGSATLTVRARAAGLTDRTATLVAAVALPRDFTLAASAVEIAQGDSAAWTVTATRSGGFDAAIPLAVTGLPPGVVTTGATIPAGETTATIVLRATLDAGTGTATAAVVGSPSGQPARSATAAVTVTPSGFAIAAGAGVSLVRGESGAVAVSVTRSGIFAGSVALTVDGLPSGVSAAPATVAADAGSANVTFSAGASAPAGITVVTVTGRATGYPDRIATVSLTVTGVDTLALALGAAEVEVEQGAETAVALTLTRSAGLSVPVALSVTGLPTGAAATLQPQVVPAAESGSALTLTVGDATPAGRYAVTVSGTAGDDAFASAVVELVVRESPVGVYDLKTVNGHVLPYTVTDDANVTLVALSGRTTLSRGGTYLWEGSYRRTVKSTGAVETGTERETGTFTVAGTEITLVDDDSGTVFVGTLQSNRLTLPNDYGDVVYEK
jgi:hypothetical protein